MRLSFIEGLCLVAIGVAMVELQDGHRFARPGTGGEASGATAVKSAAAARLEPVREAVAPHSYESRR